MKDGTYCYQIELTAPLGIRNGEMDEEAVRLELQTYKGVFSVSGTRIYGRIKAALLQQ